MNAAYFISGQPWVERLGWALVHFLWQGALIAMLYSAVRRAVSSPNARYLVACAALAAMMAAPLATFLVIGRSDHVAAASDRTARIPAGRLPVATPLPESVRATVPTGSRGELLPWVVMVWLIGVTALWMRLVCGWMVAARMRSMFVRPAPPEWQRVLQELGARIGISRPARLLVSALVQTPTVVGWLRPVVLAPVGALAGLAPEEVEALLVHELAHIRRHDYLVNILQSAVEALLFYHPAVWWVSAHIRTERELCCDDVAVSVTGDVLTYARALAELESSRQAHLQLAVAANGGSLADRIGRLLGESRPVSRTLPGPGVIVGAILLIATTYGMFAQSADKPAFQVASIKRNTDARPRGMMIRPQPGGRLTSENSPLLMLIGNAYGVQAYQIVGAPGWVNTDGYDIEAKPEGAVDRNQMWLMLQTLLADRFKLALHRETKDLPVYALTVNKSGMKQPPNPEACLIPVADAPQPPPGSGPTCGNVMVNMSSAGLKMLGGKVPMREFIRVLAMVMARPVLDKTEITREFDVELEFTPDESTMGLPGSGGKGDPGGPRLPTDSSRPTIFAALQEQLGLKLESSKGPVEVLVIDHVERPSGN